MKAIITGGAGFIGSALLWKLNKEGIDNIIVVDQLGCGNKWKNLVKKRFSDYIEKNDFLKHIEENKFSKFDIIIHLGACSSTTGADASYYAKNNYEYTRKLAEYSVIKNIKFIYASSAATYGDGELGFSDADDISLNLKPLNMYGYSKQMFDLWVLRNNLESKFTGFKFFNVYGPNEYHKADMRSLLCKKFDDVAKDKKITLFKSYIKDYKDGEQKRDFIYIKDAVDAMFHFIEHKHKAGIFNLGTGKAHSWNELVEAMFLAMNIPLKIEYINMPEVLRDKYQYFTQAEMTKMRKAGYKKEFTPLNDAIKDYVSYLKDKSYL